MKLFEGFLSAHVLACSFNANATLINVTLGVDVVFVAGAGATGTAEFEYDDALLAAVGNEDLKDSEFSMVLDLFGQIFTNVSFISENPATVSRPWH